MSPPPPLPPPPPSTTPPPPVSPLTHRRLHRCASRGWPCYVPHAHSVPRIRRRRRHRHRHCPLRMRAYKRLCGIWRPHYMRTRRSLSLPRVLRTTTPRSHPRHTRPTTQHPHRRRRLPGASCRRGACSRVHSRVHSRRAAGTGRCARPGPRVVGTNLLTAGTLRPTAVHCMSRAMCIIDRTTMNMHGDLIISAGFSSN